jgi:hypothetical protein
MFTQVTPSARPQKILRCASMLIVLLVWSLVAYALLRFFGFWVAESDAIGANGAEQATQALQAQLKEGVAPRMAAPMGGPAAALPP